MEFYKQSVILIEIYEKTYFFQFLNVEAINVDIDDWVFGCNADKFNEDQRYW